MQSVPSYCEIKFRDFEMVTLIDHLKSAISAIKRVDDYDRAIAIDSVITCINDNYNSVVNQKASQKMMVDFCQDITLWYANEVVEGRAFIGGTLH